MVWEKLTRKFYNTKLEKKHNGIREIHRNVQRCVSALYFYIWYLKKKGLRKIHLKVRSNHISALGRHFDGKWWTRNMIFTPHHQQCIFTSFTDIIIDCKCIFAGVFDLHFFTWPFGIIQTNKQYAVTFKFDFLKKY